MPATTPVTPSGNQDIDGLLFPWKWATNGFTYSFPASASFYEPGSAPFGETTNGFAALNAAQQTYVRWAVQQYAAVANLTFTEITETATTHADLRFARSNAPSTAWAYLPAPSGYGGDSWYRTSGGSYDNPVRGNYAAHTFLHEIGHALGLEHGHETTNQWGALPAAHDSLEYSVMTYRSYVGAPLSGYTYEFWGAPQTLMQNDIAALQHLYGANYNTNSGDTVYRWSPTTGQQFINGVGQAAPGGNRIFQTVWDGGGNDTFDFSNYTNDIAVDLRPGAWSTVSPAQLAYLGNGHYAAGNIATALLHNGDTRSLIENAIGGSGNDVLTGNEGNNGITGSAGNDTLYGLGGNDALTGSAGSDVLFGGPGSDYFVFSHFGTGVDSVMDFRSGEDKVALRATDLGLSVTGSLSSAGVSFVVGSTPVDTAPTILLSKASGELRWDSDGTGGTAATLFARVPVSPGEQSFFSVIYWKLLGVGDFNGDGTTDLLWQSRQDGTVAMWYMGPSPVTSVLFPVTDWTVIATADFDGDHFTDIVWQRNSDAMVAIWSMGPTSQGTSVLAPIVDWKIAGTGDFNGDGYDDIAWHRESDGLFTIWPMGPAAAAPSWALPVTAWKIVGTGDFNGDSYTDILWQNRTDGTIATWNMGSSGYAGTTVYHPVSAWAVAATGDFDGDGYDDILWESTSGNTAAVWLMSKSGIRETFTFSTSGEMALSLPGDFTGDGIDDFVHIRAQDNMLAMSRFDMVAMTEHDWAVI